VVKHSEPAVDRSKFIKLYPFRSHYLQIAGLNYHFLDEGRGEPLVMLHGNPTWSFYFRNLVLALRGSYRVIVPDHMGCGLSDKPTLARYGYRLADRVADLGTLIDALKLDRPITLVLHDWGGMIGLAWALDHLGQVGRIVVTNTAGFFPPRGKSIPRRLRLIRHPNALMEWLVLRLNLFARGALHMAPRRRLTPDVKAGLIAPYNCPAHRLATLKFVQDIPLSRFDPSGALVARVQSHLEAIGRRPAMLLWGAHDFVFDRDYYTAWRGIWPHAQAHWFENAGHYLFEDEPQRTTDCIAAFLHNHPSE
jgi:cis-3-alkyl-4-acyloxetan-2-one decarboxylase